MIYFFPASDDLLLSEVDRILQPFSMYIHDFNIVQTFDVLKLGT